MLNAKPMQSVLLWSIVLVLAGISQGANILYISAMDDASQAADARLVAFMESLSHTVTLFDDDESAADTAVAALASDLVFISETVGSSKIQNDITAVEVPIITAEGWAYYEMGLTAGDSTAGQGLETDTGMVEIVEPGHPMAAGLSGSVSVIPELELESDLGWSRLSKGQASDDATVIARATLRDGETYDTIWIYEKGAALAREPNDGSDPVAADIRICFGFEQQGYEQLTDDALRLLEEAIKYGLGITKQIEAYSAKPANGQPDVPRNVTLSWRGGAYAETHNVYFGTDFNDVNEADTDNPRNVLVGLNQTARTYSPGELAYDQTYYWRVDEVNGAPDHTVYRGPVWQFRALNFLVVDDSEAYNTEEPNQIYNTWLDGWDDSANGSLVSYSNVDVAAGERYVETEIVRSGGQAMPFHYDNQQRKAEVYLPLSDNAADWTREDVDALSLWVRGNPRYLGGFNESNGRLHVIGAGADIFGRLDQGHFVYKEMTGAVEIIARVDTLDNTDPFAKAGVMVRDTLDADARYVGVFATPENGVRYQYRLDTGGTTDREFDANQVMPYWVRINRTSGGLVRAYFSLDGNAWTRFTLRSSIMTSPWYVGLAVTSHSEGIAAEGVFSEVTITGSGSDQPWMDQDIGLLSNSLDRIYVALNNSAAVYYDDPAVTITEDWTEFRIPLQAFSDLGVNLTAITQLTLGVGTQGDTSGDGGTGILYIDDIRLYRP